MPLILTEKTGISLAVDGGNLDVSADTSQIYAGVPSGSDANPGLRFADDPNSGLYRAAADDLGISVGGTRRLRIANAAPYLQVNDGSMRDVWHAGNLDVSSGTWTPSLGATGSNPTMSYASRAGSYSRIGNLIFFEGSIVWVGNSGGSGFLTLSLPIPASLLYTASIRPSAYNLGVARHALAPALETPTGLSLFSYGDDLGSSKLSISAIPSASVSTPGYANYGGVCLASG